MARVWPKVLRGAGGQAAVLPVACDRMLILALALPPMPKSQRRAAAAFAAESFVAEPLEDVQVVLGPKLDEGTYLAVVVGRHVFAGLLAEARDRRVPLVPEVLLLPRPVAGQWTVAERGGRILARRPDGTGFAAPEPAFRAIWAQSGVPGLVWVHGTPPEVLPLASRTALPFPLTPEPALAGFDLGEGLVPDWRQPRKLGALGAVLVLGLCGHLTLLARDGQRLAAKADALEVQVKQELTQRGIPVGTSVDAAVASALKGAKGGSGPGFLTLLGSALQAMAGQTGVVTLQDIAFDSRSQQLTLTLIAPDLGPLQDTAAELGKVGLVADLGASTISQGQARASVAIKAGAAGL